MMILVDLYLSWVYIIRRANEGFTNCFDHQCLKLAAGEPEPSHLP